MIGNIEFLLKLEKHNQATERIDAQQETEKIKNLIEGKIETEKEEKEAETKDKETEKKEATETEKEPEKTEKEEPKEAAKDTETTEKETEKKEGTEQNQSEIKETEEKKEIHPETEKKPEKIIKKKDKGKAPKDEVDNFKIRIGNQEKKSKGKSHPFSDNFAIKDSSSSKQLPSLRIRRRDYRNLFIDMRKRSLFFIFFIFF